MIRISTMQRAVSVQPVMLGDASGLCARARDLNPAASIANVRDKGVFVGTTWSPPV